MENKEWQTPELTDLEIADLTQNSPGDGPDGGSALSSDVES